MKKIPLLSALLLMLLVAACSTPEKRIAGNAAVFNAWPAEVQQKVRAGQVDVGFTEEMVLVALGAPDGKSVRTTEEGTAEVWTYAKPGPHFSIGIGVGSGGGGSAYGGAVTVSDDGFRGIERMRVVISDGKVTSIERRKQ